MEIQKRLLETLSLEELEALAKKAGIPRFDEREFLKARQFRGMLVALSPEDLALLEARALVDEDHEMKGWLIERLTSKGLPEHGEPSSGEFSGGDGVGSSGFEAPEAGPSGIPAEVILLLVLLVLLFLFL